LLERKDSLIFESQGLAKCLVYGKRINELFVKRRLRSMGEEVKVL
jgi:hypothetical protein